MNRIDEVVVFHNLEKGDLSKIVEIQLKKVSERLSEQNIDIQFDPKAMSYLVEKGFSDEYGARPLKRLIQKEVENTISEMIISGQVESGQDVIVTSNSKELVYKVEVASKVLNN
ncbi:ATP-dependent Clp protease ATP-binding subunit [bacterium]|nr:ATP-dependent Clp protease ATP-binding subunit [bacterium]